MTARRTRIPTNRTVRWQGFARTAAPEGGAGRWQQRWVRGCALFMICTTHALAQDLPSGQPVTLNEVLVDQVNDESWLRFRFLAPRIARDGGDVSHADAGADMIALCETVARPYVVEYALSPDVVVITLMDRPVPFGQADVEATQFIEAFRIDSGTCIWEAF